jgi:hypothetical protein
VESKTYRRYLLKSFNGNPNLANTFTVRVQGVEVDALTLRFKLITAPISKSTIAVSNAMDTCTTELIRIPYRDPSVCVNSCGLIRLPFALSQRVFESSINNNTRASDSTACSSLNNFQSAPSLRICGRLPKGLVYTLPDLDTVDLVPETPAHDGVLFDDSMSD